MNPIDLKDLTDEKLLEKLEKLKGKGSLRGKAVCFIPQWENSFLGDSLLKKDDKQIGYILREKEFIETAKGLFLMCGDLSFVVYQKEEERIHFSIYDKNEERLSEGEKYKSRFFLLVLCFDYEKLDNTFLYEFLNYVLLKQEGGSIEMLESLGELFKFVSPSVRWLSLGYIKSIINKYYREKSLDLETRAKIEFLAKYSVENIEISSIWQEVEASGYLWCENRKKIEKKDFKIKKEDVKFFHSFESLLFYELKELFLKTKRCLNCGNVLAEGFKGKYCPNNRECQKERGKKRQRKFNKDRQLNS